MIWGVYLRGLAFALRLTFCRAFPWLLLACTSNYTGAVLMRTSMASTMGHLQVVPEFSPQGSRHGLRSIFPKTMWLGPNASDCSFSPAVRREHQNSACFQVLDLIKIFGRLSSPSMVGDVIPSPFDSVAKAARAVIAAERSRSKIQRTEENGCPRDLLMQQWGGSTWLEYDHPSLLLRMRSRTRTKNRVRPPEKWERLFEGNNADGFDERSDLTLPSCSANCSAGEAAKLSNQNACRESNDASLSDTELKRIRLYGVSGLNVKAFMQRIQNLPFAWPVTINTGQRPLRMKLVPVAREYLIDTCRRMQTAKSSGLEDPPNFSWAQINSFVYEEPIASSALGNVLNEKVANL